MSSPVFMMRKMEFEIPSYIQLDPQKRLRVEKALEQARLGSEKWRKKIHEENTARAIAMGFTSVEELEEHEMEEWKKEDARAQRRLEEQAALEGKTVAELQAELCAGNKDFYPGSPVPSLSQCQCDGMLPCSRNVHH